MTTILRPYVRDPDTAHPPYDYAEYSSTARRAPKRPLLHLAHTLTEVTGPDFGAGWTGPDIVDISRTETGEAMGQRITVEGRLLDGDGSPIRRTFVEVWQANSAGRYHHDIDQHDAPLDPHFRGLGHAVTDDDGRYRFLTVKPGAYPWRNTYNAWRPAHIHFSVFGPGFASRLITQMYFPGDPLLPYDPVYNSIPDEDARKRLISTYVPDLSQAEYSLGYQFDIVLRGRNETPMEAP